ncbi:heavy metal-binding domain-containing protein [Aerosakkonemataceae cyanobacterium BLCC-F50]|uniref:Heavy metal-binding domain-containing protein n=1 Tax=Floridaenema flaviceps BLCC-F50 TaxID=3153642 RepID=A0ABV4XUE7_9CYAN
MGLFEKIGKQIWRVTKVGIGLINQSDPQVSKSAGVIKMRSPNSQGKIFESARHRIDAQKRLGKQFFTSDLSTNEYLLTREAGCEPIGMVMGSSFYKVGFFGYFRGYRDRTGEVETLTQAQLAVRELAVSRMQQEAALLGAHGVIGVRLQQRRQGWNIGMIEFTAIGTAIRIPGRPPTSKPFTSDLSGQEFWQLRKAGYYPKGLAFGACSYYVHSDRNTRALMNQSFWNRLFGRARRNQELTQFSQGFQDARELAIMRLMEDMQKLGATGAVGMQIEAREEIIVYRPQNFLGCLSSLFILGVFIALFAAIVNRDSIAATALFGVLAMGIILIIIIQFFLSIFYYTGVFKDFLTHFVAIGTAIVEDDIPIENPVSKTLMFYPLSKS